MPHVSVYDLVGNEQHRLILVLGQRQTSSEPFAATMQHFRRVARVTEMMFLAGNKPKLKA